MRAIELAQAPDHLAQLKERIISRSAHVGVIGIGFIGLPLAVEQAKAGFQVVGVDHDHIRVAQLNNGLNYLRDVIDADLASAVASGKLTATTDFGTIRDFDVIICPPAATPAFHHDPSSPQEARTMAIDGKEFPYLYQLVWAELATTCGLPATVIPIGVRENLPIGVQIIGPEFEDRTPLAFARAIEREFGGFAPPPGYASGA